MKRRSVSIMNTRPKKKYVCFPADGAAPIFKEGMSLHAMQVFVSGYVEKVGRFYVNEYGKLELMGNNHYFPQFLGNVIMELD